MSFPEGYSCPGCSEFIGWNTEHACAGVRMATGLRTQKTTDERVAGALERIATALEREAA